MSNELNLLLLNNNRLDKHPRSWVCISGKNIPKITSQIEKEIIKKTKTSREQISKIIAKRLNCNYVSIKNILRGKNKFYPIPIMLILCELSNKNKAYLKKLKTSVNYLKVNSASAKPIKALNKLTPNLAKIIGAFCADGSLSMQFVISSKDKSKLEKRSNLGKIQTSKSRGEYYIALQVNKQNYHRILEFANKNKDFQIQTHYTIELTDEHESNVKAFNKWIKEEFEIEPTNYYNKENAWRTIFSNKILARYLIKFFDFLPGEKSRIVKEPAVIKNSNLKIRKKFARGVLMFDGTISKRKIISFTTLSEKLAGSIKDILEKDTVKAGILKNKRNEYVVYTLAKQDIKKLMQYFEEGTKKYDLLKWLDKEEFESKQLSYEKDFKETKNIFEIIKKIKICDTEYLMNNLNFSHTSIRQHLLILKLKNAIKLSNKPKRINNLISDKTTILLKKELHKKIFNKLLKKFKTYKEASKFLEIQKGTLSAWKVRKNRIPLYLIEQISKIAGITTEEIYNNVEETDREITEII